MCLMAKQNEKPANDSQIDSYLFASRCVACSKSIKVLFSFFSPF